MNLFLVKEALMLEDKTEKLFNVVMFLSNYK